MALKLQFRIDITTATMRVLQNHLDQMKIQYRAIRLGEIELESALSEDEYNILQEQLKPYGITLLDDRKNSLVQQIKDAITEMVYNSENLSQIKTSAYLEDRLHKSYSSIAKTFKEATYTSIEYYIILQKVERAKELIIADQHTLTEISFILNYSSVAHLSTQFKKTTGLSASTFLRVIKKRRQNK